MFASMIKILSKVYLNICSRRKKLMTFSGQNIGGIRVKRLRGRLRVDSYEKTHACAIHARIQKVFSEGFHFFRFFLIRGERIQIPL